jgi:hypothetical protein
LRVQVAVSLSRPPQQAAATAPRKYRGTYSGDFFVTPLTEALHAKLLQQSAGTP